MSEESRWTYRDGSRPEGVAVFDHGTKIHSFHDTDPAHGQNNVWDLVRLHFYGWLDDEEDRSKPVSERASHKAMVAFALEQPEIRAQLVKDENFEDLDITDTSWLDDESVVSGTAAQVRTPKLPKQIPKASSKLTDLENCRRIQRLYKNKLISIGKAFFCWTGTHWQRDEGDTQSSFWIAELSKTVLKEAEKFLEKAKAENREPTEEEQDHFDSFYRWSVECGQKSKLSNCNSMLRDMLGFDAEGLNALPHLLNCINGTLDLRTSTLQQHNPEDFITACAPIAYDPDAKAPRFEQFLREIHGDDEEVIAFVQRWFGYCITGFTTEHAVVFHVGQGGNGKGKTMDALKYVLGGGYYSVANQSLISLEEKGPSPEIARLLGRRMVTISETDEKLEIRDGLMKKLIGGDALSARHLFEEPFDFIPTHKLQIFTNHAPTIRTQDHAMWRRIILLNYHIKYGTQHEVDIKKAHRVKDQFLFDKLKAEAPGILKWLVDGAREWFKMELQPPPSVLAATQKYQEDQDPMGAFVRERLVLDPSAWTALITVFTAYKGWCNSVNIRPLGRNRFVQEILRASGAEEHTEKQTPGFRGIKLTDSLLDD